MEVIGMALIVGGMAYLFSGLIFLLPNPTAKRPAIVTENSDEDGCRTGVGLVRTLPASVSSIPRPAGTICASPAPDFFVEDTPTAVLVRQVLGAIAQFEKAALVASPSSRRPGIASVWRPASAKAASHGQRSIPNWCARLC
jgi:hypothetical protein